jgi:hypothetical protein
MSMNLGESRIIQALSELILQVPVLNFCSSKSGGQREGEDTAFQQASIAAATGPQHLGFPGHYVL